MSRTQVTSVLVIVCLCAALLTGCSLPHGDGTSAHTTGPLAILGTLESEPATPISEAHIVLSRGKHLIEEIAPVSGTDFTAELQVPIGTWQLTIVLLDALGEAQFQSEPQDVEVYPNNPTAIEVILRPGDGRVDLTIKLDDSPLLKHVRRARVYFNDHRTELIWDDPGEPINHVFTLAPGTYDLLIELYTESFRASDLLFPGIWQVIEVWPGEELLLEWEPLSKHLQISAVINLLPDPPVNVTAEVSNDLVQISWDRPDSPYVTGYFVYSQVNPFERPQIITPLPVDELTFTHRLDEELVGVQSITYSVAAVGEHGVVGYRSNPVTVHLEP